MNDLKPRQLIPCICYNSGSKQGHTA